MARVPALRTGARTVPSLQPFIRSYGPPETDGIHDSVEVQTSRADKSAEATQCIRKYKTKEERRDLVLQFVEKYKASNEGRWPGITLVRKEVHGSYQILKEIMQELEKEQSLVGCQDSFTEKTHVLRSKSSQSDKAALEAEATEQGPLVAPIFPSLSDKAALEGEATEQGTPQKASLVAPTFPSLESSQSDKAALEVEATEQGTPQKASLESSQSDKAALKGEATEHGTPQKASLGAPILPSLKSSQALDDADDDSDLAAPEYSISAPSTESSFQKSRKEYTEPSWFGMFVNFMPAQATDEDFRKAFKDCGEIGSVKVFPLGNRKSRQACGVVNFKTAEGLKEALGRRKKIMGELMAKFGFDLTRGLESQDNGVTDSKHARVAHQVDTLLPRNIEANKNEAARSRALCGEQLMVKDQYYRIRRQANPLTTVVRLSNLSSEVTTSKLQSSCENIASVIGLDVRKEGSVDVHFDVKDAADMSNIIERLSNLTLGERKLKVSSAPRFFCGTDPDYRFKAQDAQSIRQLKDTVLKQVEQNMEQLSIGLQDYREFVALKQAKMLEVFGKS